MESIQSISVIIVGAGLSGLSAALTLLESKEVAKVIMLEARKRVGGRTESIPVDDDKVDVGAQWIASQHTEMLLFCQRFNLELLDQYYAPSSHVQPNEYECCLTECVNYPKQLASIHDSKAVQGYIELIEELSKTIDLSFPWLHPQASEWDYISIEQHIQTQNYSKVATTELLLFVQVVFAAIASDISFLFALFLIKSGGGIAALSDGNDGAQRYKVKGGIQQISEILLNQILTQYPDMCEIHYGHAVQGVVINERDKAVEVKARNGQTYYANHAIFAMAPKLTSEITFKPPLPNGQQLLFDSMVSGHAIKVFLSYAEPFWLQSNNNSPDSRSTDQSEGYVHFTELGYIHNLYHAVLHQKITNDNGNYYSFVSEAASSVTTSVLKNKNEIPSLVGLITGQSAVDFALLSESERKEAVLNQLHRMYHHPLALTPLHYIEKIWSNEEFSKGCYACSFPPNGVFSQLGHYLRDRDESQQCLHWASTETTEEFYGYMEGAVRSGQRAAREIITK